MTESWKVTLPCTRAEAEALTDDMGPLADLDSPPVLVSQEAEPDNPARWIIEAYFETQPTKAIIGLLRSLVPSAGKTVALVERIDDEDWVTLSQSGIEPVSVGRFHIRHRADEPELPGRVNYLIPASTAFGTGQHETTSGCLLMLEAMHGQGARFRNIADVGTGTGLLAFAAMELWPQARAIASDIDPVSVEVTRDNALANGIKPGAGPGRLALAVAGGVAHRTIQARAPYDLLIANILAGPLIALAPSLSACLADRGSLVLAGLLAEQADRVIATYRRHGLRLVARNDRGAWPTLHLVKARNIGRPPSRSVIRRKAETPGFGSW